MGGTGSDGQGVGRRPTTVGPPPGHPERLVQSAALDAEKGMLWADILGPYRAGPHPAADRSKPVGIP
ncbi:DUF6059 family protein [Streptomyces sp. NPDC058469]|uniref:DUF6059 family protein n=1 Tax=Streptomyces sp. NPDC058469 TaxID=3346514 RepID=UPI00365C3673